MNSLVLKEIKKPGIKHDGVYDLFEFAFGDYFALLETTEGRNVCEANDKFVFGFCVDPNETPEDIRSLIDLLSKDVTLLVIGLAPETPNANSSKIEKRVKEVIDLVNASAERKWAEIPNVYEDRLVFERAA